MEHEEYKIYHKIEPNRKIMVFKNTFNDMNFYKVQIIQKNYDKTSSKFFIDVQFKKNVSLENQTMIIIKKAYENFRENPNDKYHPILYLNITDFETVEQKEKLEKKAYEDFRENLDETEIEITDDEIPF